MLRLYSSNVFIVLSMLRLLLAPTVYGVGAQSSITSDCNGDQSDRPLMRNQNVNYDIHC